MENVINISGDVNSITQDERGTVIDGKRVGGGEFGSVEVRGKSKEYIDRVGETAIINADEVSIINCKSCQYEVVGAKKLFVLKNTNTTITVYTADKAGMELRISDTSNVMTTVTYRALSEYKEPEKS